MHFYFFLVLLCVFFFLNKKLKKTKKIFINIIFFLIPLAVLISGERSNFIKCLILFSLILFFIKSNQLLISKFKVFILVLSMVFISIIVSPNIYIKQTEFFKRIFISNNAEKFLDRFQKITYLSHYDVAWEIFKDNPINGVGSKNFRIKCAEEKYFNTELLFSSKRCSTHPHQLHFELLSEQGIIGYLLFFYLALRFIFTNLSKSFESRNIFFTGINLYLLVFLIPLLPGGSIFSTLNGSLFWLIFALANMRFNKKILD